MAKDRNSHSLASGDDFSLPRAKILRGRKNFQRLFEKGVHVFHTQHTGLRYRIVDDNSFGCLMGFIVKKSLGKAYKRNHMKRLLREAYRLNQHILADPLQKVQITLHGALVAYTADVTFDDVEPNVITLLTRVRDQLPTASSSRS